MKKILICAALILALIFALSACGSAGGKTDDAVIDYGSSELYSQQDMDEAIAAIEKEFSTWKGCELHSIRYAGDDCSSEDNIRWMNQLNEGAGYTQCIGFVSDFHSPVKGDGQDAWQYDTEYTDWQWWLARTDGGAWELLTWGY